MNTSLLLGEHLRYGLCTELLDHLSNALTVICKFNIVPHNFTTGILIPILKKTTLNPTLPENYRPLTLSTTFSKLFETISAVTFTPADTQFGFVEGRGCEQVAMFINDLCSLSVYSNDSLFITSLDAAKCFDCVWHAGLFFKLLPIMPTVLWRFYYQWYLNLVTIVRVNDVYGSPFKVTRGIRQGSKVSPLFFNVFINELLSELQSCNAGIRTANNTFNHVAYADDLTLFSSTAIGMQCLINMCEEYAKLWRFQYNPQKTQAAIVSKNGRSPFVVNPTLLMYQSPIKYCNDINVLGCTFGTDGSCTLNAENRLTKFSHAFHAMSHRGLTSPYLTCTTKSYLFKTGCQSVLMYALGAFHFPDKIIKMMDKAQGRTVKKMFRFPLRCHNSSLLRALGIIGVKQQIGKRTASLVSNVFKCSFNPCQLLYVHLLKQYYQGIMIPGTSVHRLLQYGFNPTTSMLRCAPVTDVAPMDGVADSIKFLMFLDPFLNVNHDVIFNFIRCF